MTVTSLRKPLPFPTTTPGTTLSLGAKFNARTLGKDLALATAHAARLAATGNAPSTSVTRGKSGLTGPNGEPLFQMQLNGKTVYVDPNTNKFYLSALTPREQMLRILRPQEKVHGPFDMPTGAQFPNEHYSSADVSALGAIARSGASNTWPSPQQPPRNCWLPIPRQVDGFGPR